MIITLLWAMLAQRDALARADGGEEERRRRIEAEVRELEATFARAQEAPTAQDPQEQPAVIRGLTVEAIIELVARKTKYKYRFMWEEAQASLKTGRIHYLVPEAQLPQDGQDEEWFHLLKKILLASGIGLFPLRQEKEIVWHIRSLASRGAGQPGASTTPLDPIVLSEVVTDAFYKFNDKGEYLPSFQIIAKYVKLDVISTAEAVGIIQQAFPGAQQLSIIEFPTAREILVVNYDNVVFRIEQILKKADVRVDTLADDIIELENALATDVASIVTAMMQVIVAAEEVTVTNRGIGGGGATQIPQQPRTPTQGGPGGTAQEPFLILPDPRTNSLIVLAHNLRFPRIRELIGKLDAASKRETFVVNVYHLKNVLATDLVQILERVFTGQLSVTGGGLPRDGGIPASGGGGGPSLGGAFEPTFVNDDPSNSVIVVADRNTQKKIEALIKQLDRRRPQVYIKCTVVQISAEETYDLGVELAGLEDPDGGIEPGGRSNFGLSDVIDVNGDGIPDIVPRDLPGGSLFFFKERIGNLLANIHMNEGVSDVRILEEPELIALDNSEAVITVQTEVPVLTTTVTGTGVAQTVFDHFEAASTILTISPHISEGNYVTLNIDILVEKFLAAVAADSTIPPPRSSRQIVTSVNVPDRYTVVIGGLITNDVSETTQGVPFLYKIPILGHLFRRDQETRRKTSLYVFVTPVILQDYGWGDEGEVSRERKESIEEMGQPLDQLTPHPPPFPTVNQSFKYERPIRAPEEKP